MPRPPLSDEAVEQQRERAIRVAVDLFVREGAEAVSVRSIASAVGLSPMALYRYFPNGKDELLTTVRGGGFEQLAAELETAIGQKSDPIDQIASSAEALVRFACQRPGLYRLMFDMTQPEEKDAYLATRRARAWELAKKPFETAARAGLIRRHKDDCHHLVFAAVHGVISFELSAQPYLERRIDRLLVPMLEVLFTGLGSEPATIRRLRRRLGGAK